jgi:hypothetical protein
MRSLSQSRFLPIPLLILVLIATLSFPAISTKHLRKASASTIGQTPDPSMLGTQPRPTSSPQHCSSCPPPSPRRIYAPAIELPEAGECEIVLNSRSPHPIDITPTLYTVDGEQVTGDAVTLQPAEIRFVPIKSLIPDGYQGKRRWGGIALSYTGGFLEVWAQISFRGVGGKGSIDETFNLFEDQGSDTREGVWLMPKGGSAVIALGNSSDAPIQTTVQFSNGESEVVNISPFATAFVRRHAGDASSDSVKLTTIGPAGALRVAGFVLGGVQHFNSSIRFADTKKAAQSNLYATNLRLENSNPRMLIENTGDYAVSAAPKFFPATGDQGNPIELPAIAIAPHQITDVDLRPLIEAATTRSDLKFVSAQVINSGAPGSIIGALYSTDRRKGVSYDVPFRDSGVLRNSTGSYPWRVDDDYTTIVNITNISDHPASFIVDIRYPGGHYFVPAKELPASGTATFDLRKLISEQKPDNQGNVIPLSTTGGQFHWSIFKSPPSSKFIGRSEVVSVSGHVSSSYSCPTCCPDSGPFGDMMAPDPVVIGGFAQVNTSGTVTDCNGNSTNIGWFAMDEFWVDNPAIVSYSPEWGSYTIVQGLAAGETAINGIYSWDRYDFDGWSICYESRGQDTVSQPVQTVTVALSFRSSGAISTDNSARSTFSSLLGTTNLGNFLSSGTNPNHIWRVAGVEIVGTVTPSTYTGNVVIHRTIVESRSYTDNNATPTQTITNQDDTSDSPLRDDDPQSGSSGGKVYDLDAPGIGTTSSAPVGRIVRRRVNFSQYVTVNGATVPGSVLTWYARQSVIKTASGDQLVNDISGDNTVGTGTTNLTWNLQ